MKQIIKISKTLSMMSFILLAGCGGGSGGTSEEIITPIVTPPPVNNAPSCSTTDYPNLEYCTVQHLDLDREFYVYVPDGLNTPITLAPLLFNLHGYRRQALDFLGYSGFQSLAEQPTSLLALRTFRKQARIFCLARAHCTLRQLFSLAWSNTNHIDLLPYGSNSCTHFTFLDNSK